MLLGLASLVRHPAGSDPGRAHGAANSDALFPLVRNTPLHCVHLRVRRDCLLVKTPFLVKGVTALTIYTSAFVCEAIRSGVNSVSLGQAEAARAIGLTFGSTMSQVVLPQAFRATVPPLASCSSRWPRTPRWQQPSARRGDRPDARPHQQQRRRPWLIFMTFAIGYIIIVEVMSRERSASSVAGG